MEKKNYLHLTTIMIVAMLCVVFASCGSDDDEMEGGKVDSPLIGTWEHGTSDAGAIIVFKSNGTVVWDSNVKGDKKHSEGTFDASSGSKGVVKIYWSGNDYPEIWEFTINGDKLTTKASISGASVTWTKK